MQASGQLVGDQQGGGLPDVAALAAAVTGQGLGQAGGDGYGGLRVELDGPGQGFAAIGQVGCQGFVPVVDALPAAEEVAVGLLEQVAHGQRVALAQGRFFVHGGELLQRVAAGRVQQAVARGDGTIGNHQRTVDQRAQHIHHGPGIQPFVGHHLLGQFQRKAAQKHAQAAKHGLLSGIQQAIAPFECGAQGFLPRGRAPATAVEQAQAFVQRAGQRHQAQQRHAGRGQLDGQRQAVQAAADIHHRGQVLRGQCEAPVGRLGALGKQRHRATFAGHVQRRALVG